MKEKISTIVITFNSEATIEKCLKSAMSISDEIIIVDSFSTDRTVEICKNYTKKIFTHKWLGYSKQKEIAVEKAVNSWILWIDSDEELSSELIFEIQSLNFSCTAYYLNRKNYYLNRWINHCGWYPDYIIRLFRKDKGRFSNDIIHEKVVINGKIDQIKGILYHYSYRDISHHLEKMNSFTSAIAQKMFQQNKKVTPLTIIFHSVWYFFRTYILKKGYLDGFAGFIVCVLGGYYVFLKYIKLWELYKYKVLK